MRYSALFLFALLVFAGGNARAQDIVINEIYADVTTDGECGGFGEPSGATFCGDANRDYVVDTSDDEFVELVNISNTTTVDLSNWTLSDDITTRHTFPAGTLLAPRAAIVVFGGGTPGFVFSGAPGTSVFGGSQVQTASSGTLHLTETGDTLTLRDDAAEVVASYTLVAGITDGNESVVRDPDETGSDVLVKHFTEATGALNVASPGTRTDGSFFGGICPADIPYLDLSQTSTNANSPNSVNHWQSFIAGRSGTLSQIDVRFTLAGAWTLNVYSGTGNGGTQLNTGQSVTLTTGEDALILDETVTLVKGNTYTF
ncbi:MAG: lamin tail domain-containing protein, partial [Gammaproteobacteria bacterium]|nr:lamin tail domain-containing protein [Gammaproteobacteria bacterium]